MILTTKTTPPKNDPVIFNKRANSRKWWGKKKPNMFVVWLSTSAMDPWCMYWCMCIENGATGTWTAWAGQTGTSCSKSSCHGCGFVNPRWGNIGWLLSRGSGDGSTGTWKLFARFAVVCRRCWVSSTRAAARQLFLEIFGDGGELQSCRLLCQWHSGRRRIGLRRR